MSDEKPTIATYDQEQCLLTLAEAARFVGVTPSVMTSIRTAGDVEALRGRFGGWLFSPSDLRKLRDRPHPLITPAPVDVPFDGEAA